MNATPLTQRMVLLAGSVDGDPAKGQVTYLAGHDYTVALPITSNPQTCGVRVFLNSLFATGCASNAIQPDVNLTISAPAVTSSNTIHYTIGFMNPGLRPVENLRLTQTLPAGTAFVSASSGGTHAGGLVTWNLPPLASGSSNSVAVTVNTTFTGRYTSTARLRFSHLLVKEISQSVTTIPDGPILSLVRTTPGQGSVSWAPNTPGYRLQESPSLSPVNWSNAASGAQNPSSITLTNTRFFRLFKL